MTKRRNDFGKIICDSGKNKLHFVYVLCIEGTPRNKMSGELV